MTKKFYFLTATKMKYIKLISIFLIITWTFSCSNNVENKNGYTYTKWQVNSNGKKIRKIEYKRFDKNENIMIWIQYLESGKSMIDSFSYTFKADLKIEEKNYNPNGLFSIAEFEYDSNKKLQTKNSYDRNKKLESYFKHKYIGSKEIVENYSSLDGLFAIDTIVYNNQNKVVSEIQYMTDGNWFQKHLYDYDSKGNLINRQSQANPIYDGIGVVETRYTNNDKNRPIKETVIFPDKSKEYNIYEYNDN